MQYEDFTIDTGADPWEPEQPADSETEAVVVVVVVEVPNV